ncbi:hypothetical protein QBC47DRAFT_379763 [Echria macrotheca]|uniref:Transmembrane protein n=1 Tax=Echria macrotheca TaxID=438768 RepID=A0AAJ0F739_9PEZI|nr:hypothetical protein QBC47DRAFT_379763 [Echria macrotheca]
MLMLKRFPHSFGLSVSHLLVVVLYLVGVALQFSSTLLVSDLGDITILSDPEVRRVAVADSEGAFIGTNGQFMFSKTPGVWSTFAESRNGTGTVSQNVTDTGIITRAFPPFESRERLLLRSYSGLAVTQQARTICVPAELNVQRTTLTYAASDQLMVQGAVSMSLEPFTAAGFRTEKYNYTNGVPVVVDRPTRMIDIPFACPFYNIQGGGRGVKGDDLAMALCFIQSGFFEPFLLVNAVGPFADWNSYATSGFQPVSTENSWATYKPTGPNSTSESFQPKDGLRLSASVCSTAWNNSILSVNASTSAPTQEYPLQWENSTQSWNTPEILRLLGVVGDPSDVGARGILRLDSYGPANDKTIVSILSTGPSDQVSTELYKAFTAALEGQEVDPLTNKDLAGFNRSLIFCSRCYPSTQINNDLAHPSSVLLMGAALNATNNPAAALDGLWTTWTQTAYTSAVGQLDQAGVADSTMMWAVTVTTPVRWHGFIATTVLLVFHIAVAVAIMVLFVGRTAYSFQGNFWPAMAQATGGEQVREFLDDVATTPDSEVDKIIKVRGLDGVSVCTGVDEGTGRVGLIRTKAL